jgi:hypothetical protein
MTHHSGFSLRLKTLQFDIEEVNRYYKETRKIPLPEIRVEDGNSVSFEEMGKLLIKQYDTQSPEVEKLYSRIFNFTQTFYSIKEYLKKIYPEQEQCIEDFFSNELFYLPFSRKDISNDLKHHPDLKDLKLKNLSVGRSQYPDCSYSIFFLSDMDWFYGNINAVPFCNNLYKELLEFLKGHNFNE